MAKYFKDADSIRDKYIIVNGDKMLMFTFYGNGQVTSSYGEVDGVEIVGTTECSPEDVLPWFNLFQDKCKELVNDPKPAYIPTDRTVSL